MSEMIVRERYFNGSEHDYYGRLVRIKEALTNLGTGDYLTTLNPKAAPMRVFSVRVIGSDHIETSDIHSGSYETNKIVFTETNITVEQVDVDSDGGMQNTISFNKHAFLAQRTVCRRGRIHHKNLLGDINISRPDVMLNSFSLSLELRVEQFAFDTLPVSHLDVAQITSAFLRRLTTMREREVWGQAVNIRDINELNKRIERKKYNLDYFSKHLVILQKAMYKARNGTLIDGDF